MRKGRLKLNRFLREKQTYKYRAPSLLSKSNMDSNIPLKLSRKLNALMELSKHYGIKPSGSIDNFFDELTLRILMDAKGINPEGNNASFLLYEKISTEHIPAAKLVPKNDALPLGPILLTICVELCKTRLGSINSACTHLIKKYGFPQRTRQIYYDTLKDERAVSDLSVFRAITQQIDDDKISETIGGLADHWKKLVRK